MKTFFKRLIISLLILIALLVIMIGLFIWQFDGNALKAQASKAVHEKTGHTLTIDGDIDMKLFPWIGASVGRTSLGLDDASEPLFTFNAADVKVKLLPLLKRDIELKTIVLDGFNGTLIILDGEGTTNWHALSSKDDATTTSDKTASADEGWDIDIDGIDIKNASLNVLHNPKQQHWQLKAGHAAVSNIADNQPFDITASGTLSDITQNRTIDIDGDAVVDAGWQQGELSLSNIHAAINVLENVQKSYSVELAVASAKLDDTKTLLFTDTKAKIKQDSQNFVLPFSGAAEIKQGSFKANHINLDALTLDGEHMTVARAVPFTATLPNVVYDIQKAEVAPATINMVYATMPMTVNLNAAGMQPNIFSRGTLRIDTKRLSDAFQALNIARPDVPKSMLSIFNVDATFDFNPERVVLTKARGKLDNSAFNGDLTWGLGTPELKARGTIDALNTDQYLPKTAKANTQNTQAVVKQDTSLAWIKANPFTQLNTDIDASIGTLTSANLVTTDVTFKAVGEQGAWRVFPSTANVYGGTYSGDIRLTIDPNKPLTLSINETFENVDFAKLLSDLNGEKRLSGIVNGRVQASMTGDSVGTWQQTAKGESRFEFNDGTWHGIDLEYQVKNIQAKLKRLPLPETPANPQTRFSNFKATTTINDGKLNARDVSMRLPFMLVEGNGDYGLTNQSLDFTVKLNLLENKSIDDGLRPWIGFPIPIHIEGTAAAPKVDITQLLIDMTKIFAKINIAEKLGLDANQAAIDEKKDEAQADIDQKKEELKDKIDNKVKDKLRDLLGG